MNNFHITDQIFAFCNKVAAGEDAYKAYIQHLAKKKIRKESAKSSASKLMARPEVQQKIEELKRERGEKITEVNREITEQLVRETMETLPPEFFGLALTVENCDSLHFAIIKGLVEVEEVLPIKKRTYLKGKVIDETVNFMKVKRKPNIRERQASIDALYKRWGSYAPVKGAFGFGKLGGGDEEDGAENVQRYVMLANGEKIPFE